MPFLLALASAVFYGSADFVGGLVSRRLAAIPVVLVSQAAGLVVVVLLLPLLPAASPTTADFWWGAAAGLAGGTGVALLYHALAIGTMSVVAPTTAVAAVTIPVVASIALGERPGLLAMFGIVLGIGAIILVSQQNSSLSTDGARARSLGVGTALGAGVAVGFFLLTLAQTRAAAGMWPLVAARGVSVTLIGLVAVARRTSLRMTPRLGALTVVCGLVDMLANALYMLAAQTGPLSPVVTLSSLYPATTVLLARAVLGERLNAWQSAGVVCALIAVVLIVAGGS
ncbi:MAG TPA: DMT family transporter [Gemmatimonadaceae bacterium]|nr:DMT family transporter [Gemmatimonadaceae bacterium]